MGTGAPSFILNVEELATIFHFPMATVKAPLLKKTEAKRGEAPFSLPVSPLESEFIPPPPPSIPIRASVRRAPAPSSTPTVPSVPAPVVPSPQADAAAAPENLPFV